METKVYNILLELLSNEQILNLNLRLAHWNITGDGFLTNHKYFGDLYNVSSTIVDDLAEKMRIIGFNVPGNYQTFIDNSSLTNEDYLIFDMVSIVNKLVNDYIEYIDILSTYLNNVRFDKGLENYLIGLLESRQKELWILKSHL